ncbi:D-tagatose-bisphosphate aldolase, class II, non-catalytic subunit [Thermanaerothrix sp.]|uniref:D-tagatose-bisphosphate aldolase, class II, non-catalytic subunit n=1 Tax=Thermanaerothrix sp. TaxID=2972675 RepID=UPI002ADE69A5|nr:D-tagatose-bisphosphate aldolase, class II, non-catalytic subunit [Thermanaerothrix sp.]
MITYLDFVVQSHQFNRPLGITSICSAHPYVIEAALRNGKAKQIPVLIEATCNQVNQYGGYTGMTPADFVRFVEGIALRVGFPRERILLGGDHLGPLVWANEPAASAMAKAGALVRAYVEAGFRKIHLDCSMPCADDHNFSPAVVAERAAELAAEAEAASQGASLPLPRYVIGTEVPPAGGAKAEENRLLITRPEDAAETLELTRQAFLKRGLDGAWERVVAMVVQPGVEFGDAQVHEYHREEAQTLSRFIEAQPGLVYEAHSTDYQSREALRALVEDHFAILKVGPALTFAFREAVFALAAIEEVLCDEPSRIVKVLEDAMLSNPKYWVKYYRGDERALALARRYSFSDRIRYYWATPAVEQAFQHLRSNLTRVAIPLTLLSQYLPQQYRKVREGWLANAFDALVLDKIQTVLEDYNLACGLG